MHRFQSRDGQPYNFTDGLVIKDIDLSGDQGFKAISMKIKSSDVAPTTLYDWMNAYTSKHVDSISPYDKGAKGDGSADDVALQAWLDAIGTDTPGAGKVGILPDGIFRHYTKLIFNKQYYYIRGAGALNSILKGPGFALKANKLYLSINAQDFTVDTTDHQTQVSFTGSISGNILTVTSAPTGPLTVNARLSIPVESDYTNIYITEFVTGTGGVGTYRTNKMATSTDSYPGGTTFLATSGPSPIDVSGTAQYILNSSFTNLTLNGVEHAITCPNFTNSILNNCSLSSKTLAPALLYMQGGSELRRVQVGAIPSSMPGFRLYGRGVLNACQGDTSVDTTKTNTFFAIVGSNPLSKNYSRDLLSNLNDSPDFIFNDCLISNFAHAGIVVDGVWRRIDVIGGGFDRTLRTDSYGAAMIFTCGPVSAGVTSTFNPSTFNMGTGTLVVSSLFDMPGAKSAYINKKKNVGNTFDTHVIDRSGYVPVVTNEGTYQQSIEAFGATISSDIGSAYQISRFTSRVNHIQVNCYISKAAAISGTAATLDVTGYSKILLSGAAGSKLSKASFIDASNAEYDAAGKPIVAKFTGDITNGTVGVAGTTLNVTSLTSGTIMIGTAVIGAGVAANTYVSGYLTGTGGVGTYTVSISQLASSGGNTWTCYHPNGNDTARNGELVIEFADTNCKIAHSTTGVYTFRLTAGVDYTPAYAGAVIAFRWSETLRQFVQQ